MPAEQSDTTGHLPRPGFCVHSEPAIYSYNTGFGFDTLPRMLKRQKRWTHSMKTFRDELLEYSFARVCLVYATFSTTSQHMPVMNFCRRIISGLLNHLISHTPFNSDYSADGISPGFLCSFRHKYGEYFGFDDDGLLLYGAAELASFPYGEFLYTYRCFAALLRQIEFAHVSE